MQLRACNGMLVLACVSLLAGCSGGGGGGGASNMERLAKAWEHESGDLFDLYSLHMGELRWLVLEDNGAGEILSRRTPSGAVGCGRVLVHAIDDEVLSFDLGLDPAADFGGGPPAQLLRWTIEDGHLTLENVDGRTAVFARRDPDDVPAADRCEVATLTDLSLPLPPTDDFQPVFAADLDGDRLWYATGSGFFDVIFTAFDPATGDSSGSAALPHPELHAWQGEDAWMGTHSGSNSDLYLLDAPGFSEYSPLGHVDTEELGYRTSMGNALLDSAGLLWIAGRGFDSVSRILVVDPPDVVVKVIPLDTRPQQIAFRAGELWALQDTLGTMLVQIDRETGLVIRNVELPEVPGTRWRSLASAGGEIYVYQRGIDDYQSYRFARVELP